MFADRPPITATMLKAHVAHHDAAGDTTPVEYTLHRCRTEAGGTDAADCWCDPKTLKPEYIRTTPISQLQQEVEAFFRTH